MISDDSTASIIRSVLEESRSLGFLGPGDVKVHLDHSLVFADALREPARILDLGSGGGIPGLVLATLLTDCRFDLLDSNIRRCAFLRSAIEQLGIVDRAEVLEGRAEELARDPQHRHAYDHVVARSFGPPAVVAECAVGFMSTGSRLIVSEPPDDVSRTRPSSRWNTEGLELLGLTLGERISHPSGTLQILIASEPCSERYPRRNGVPLKRPIFQ